jgi:hypothetical protein
LNKNITKFESGAIRDTSSDKEDYIETISWLAMRRFAKYMTSKQSTYGPGNWKKGIPVESYERSALRHIQKYLANKYDGANLEPNEDHLAAALFNIFGILHEEETKKIKESFKTRTDEDLKASQHPEYKPLIP